MVAITGIGGPAEPLPTKGPGNRDQKNNTPLKPEKDALEFSAEALEASQAAEIFRLTPKQEEIREQRIEVAKEQIREGTYKVQDVVTEVAARLTRFL